MGRKRRGGHGGGREKRGRTNDWSANKPSGGNYGEIRMENQLLEEYYKTLLNSEDFDKAFASFRTSLPACVRVNRSVPLWRATIATIEQLQAQAMEDAEKDAEKATEERTRGDGGATNAAEHAATGGALNASADVLDASSTNVSSMDASSMDEDSSAPVTEMEGTPSSPGTPRSCLSTGVESCRILSGAGLAQNGMNSDASGGLVKWCPTQLVWQWTNLNRVAIKKNKKFAALKQFLISEDTRGALIRQEAASMIPPLFMDLHPDHLVLDMCAAPGSKTSQILEELARSNEVNSRLSESQGGVIANEIDIKRASMLTHQLLRLGLPSMAITCCDAAVFPSFYRTSADGSQTTSRVGSQTRELLQFDRILADVPCSGDGTLRKQPDIWKVWNVSGGVSLHCKQIAILRRGLELLKVGGRLVYSTCSLNPVENEAVVGTILTLYSKHVELIRPDDVPELCTSPGMTTWKVAELKTPDQLPTPIVSQDESPESQNKESQASPSTKPLLDFYSSFEDVPLERRCVLRPSMFPQSSELPLQRCFRIFPHQNNTGGFFVAVFTKLSELPPPQTSEKTETGKEKEQEIPKENDTPTQSSDSRPPQTNSRQRGRRPADATGLHAHVFKSVDVTKPDLVQMSKFFGFDSTDLEEVGAGVTSFELPADKVDLRLLAKSSIKVLPPHTTPPTKAHSTAMPRILSAEDLQSAGECQSVFGPRPVDVNLGLDQFVFREHTDKRLYLTSKAVQRVTTQFSCPDTSKWVSLGIRVLEVLDPKQTERYEGCKWRLTQEGLLSVVPYLRRRVIFINLTIAKPFLTGSRTITGLEVLRGELQGQILNLGSCRDDSSDGFSKFVPGSLAVVIVPPTLIPIEGHFPDAVVDLPEVKIPTDENGNPVREIKGPRDFDVEFEMTNPCLLGGSLKDCLPIAALLTKSGTLLPYIAKDEAAGLLFHLFGKSSPPTTS